MKTKFFLTILLFAGILISGCVKDDIYVDETVTSDVLLVINEVASNNGDPNPDWIELYNPSEVDLDISGFGLYDKPTASSSYRFPAGTIISAKGYLVYVCGTDGGTFSVSSTNGETVYLYDAADALIDEVAVPKIDQGVSYARIPDGEAVWSLANPTQGVANSNTNEAPILIVNPITNIDDNSDYDFIVTASDAGGIRDVKLYMESATDVQFVEMAPTGGGTYKYKIPAMTGGTVVKYYVVATDETAKKSYYPETAPTTNATFTVANGSPEFVSVVFLYFPPLQKVVELHSLAETVCAVQPFLGS